MRLPLRGLQNDLSGDRGAITSTGGDGISLQFSATTNGVAPCKNFILLTQLAEIWFAKCSKHSVRARTNRVSKALPPKAPQTPLNQKKKLRPCPLRRPDGRCCGCCNRSGQVGEVTLLYA